MVDHEREIGRIEEGIRNLNKRYDSQEGRLSRLEESLSEIRGMILGEPAHILKIMEERFVTKDQIKPIERTYALIIKSSVALFVLALGAIATVLIYFRRVS